MSEFDFIMEIKLFSDKPQYGFLSVYSGDQYRSILYPERVFVYLAVDREKASANRNATLDSLLPYGPAPLGRYKYDSLVRNPSFASIKTSEGHSTYSNYYPIQLSGVDGPVKEAKRNGRSHIWIHGGDLDSEGNIRPTFGCIRVEDHVIASLNMHFIEFETLIGPATMKCDIVQSSDIYPGGGRNIATRSLDPVGDPPPGLPIPAEPVQPIEESTTTTTTTTSGHIFTEYEPPGESGDYDYID
jgi:hypothetical protein